MSLLDAIQSNAVLFYGVVAFLGLFVGSFLNVVIYRLPVMMQREWQQGLRELAAEQVSNANESGQNADAAAVQVTEQTANATDDDQFNLSVPRSRCPECGSLIKWWQNVPVISYLLLGGKCAHCKTPISKRYPLIELVTMILSLIVAWKFGPSAQAVLGILVTWFLVAMTMIDFDHCLLPDSLTLPLLWVGLVASLFPIFADVRAAVIGAAAGYLVLWLVFHTFKLLTGKEGMGYGDFKLLAALGALLGWQQLPMVILLSSLVGAFVGISLIVFKKQDRSVPIPFGPYLAAAGWIAMLWGEQISGAYLSLYA